MENDDSVTFNTLLIAFTDFLTVAIHTILYERAIYPRSSFLTARKYNFSVRQNRHPKVCQWIQDAITAIESELLCSSVDRIALVILSPLQLPLERFVFEVSRFPVIKPEEANTPLQREGHDLAQSSLIDLQEQFRGAMSRLAVCGGRLRQLPKSCSFTIAIETKKFRDPPIGHPQHFIPVQPISKKAPSTNSSESHKSAGKLAGIVPVRTIETSDLHLEMWIEEVKNKGDSDSAQSIAKV